MGAKKIQWGKDSLINKQCWVLASEAYKLDSHMQKNETGPLSYTGHKN